MDVINIRCGKCDGGFLCDNIRIAERPCKKCRNSYCDRTYDKQSCCCQWDFLFFIVPSANLSGVSVERSSNGFLMNPLARFTTPLLIPGSAREGAIIKSGHIGNMSWMSVSTGTTGCKQRKLEAEVR